MKLSITSCAYLQSIYLWQNVSSAILPSIIGLSPIVLSCNSALYILNKSALSDNILQVSPHSLWIAFSFLQVSFQRQSFFFLILIVYLFFLLYKVCAFCVLFRKPFQNLQSVRLLIHMFHRNINSWIIFKTRLAFHTIYCFSGCCKCVTVPLNLHHNLVRYGVFLLFHREGKWLRVTIGNSWNIRAIWNLISGLCPVAFCVQSVSS